MSNSSAAGVPQGSKRPAGRDVIVVPCTLQLEQTRDALYAYAELQGCDVGPGDEVLIHDAPTSIAFGQRASFERRATVKRAGPWRRFWAHVEGYLELTELYEVSFTEGRAR